MESGKIKAARSWIRGWLNQAIVDHTNICRVLSRQAAPWELHTTQPEEPEAAQTCGRGAHRPASTASKSLRMSVVFRACSARQATREAK